MGCRRSASGDESGCRSFRTNVLYALRDAAALLGIGMTRFYRIVNAGDVMPLRVPDAGRRPLSRLSEIDATGNDAMSG